MWTSAVAIAYMMQTPSYCHIRLGVEGRRRRRRCSFTSDLAEQEGAEGEGIPTVREEECEHG